jgi:hypothetical protein
MSAGDRPGALPRERRRGVLLALLVVVLAGALAITAFGAVAAGTASAQTAGNESSPPELHSGEKLNTTAVELLIIDDVGVQSSSIDADDFLLSDGDIEGVRATETGTNATVTLVLAEPIPNDELLVGIASGSDIRNINGTTIRAAEAEPVTVTGMDGVAPGVLGTDVGDAVGGPAEIEFRFDEPLSAIDVEITGPENVTLDIEDFENPRSNSYVAEYEPPESGEYSVALESATDTAGNSGNFSIVRTIDADRSSPEAVIGIDFGASSGTNVTFDASQSSGNRLTYTWDFGGGTASGERVSHEFTPEEHTVTLTVEDGFGQTDVTQVDLNLTGGLGTGEDVVTENETATPAVIIDRGGSEESPSSLVSVTGAIADQRLDIGTLDDSEPPLVTRDAIALDRLSVSPTVNTSFSVALSAVGARAITDATGQDSVGIGGFTLLSDIRPAEMSDAEFTFSVTTDRLDTLDLSPEEIELRREANGEWVRLNTTVITEGNDSYQFAATSPGFSRFAIVATSEPIEESNTSDGTDTANASASIEVTDASLDTTEIRPGETVQVSATVENSGDANGTFRAGLELDDTVVETTEVEVGAGDSETVTFTPQLDEAGTVSVAVNGTAAGEVTVQESAGNESDREDELDVNPEVFTVTNVSLSRSSIAPGENVTIEGDVLNEGEEIADFIAELEVDGEVVDTFEVPKVPGGEDIPVMFTRQFNETGTYNISISGTASESKLAVGQSDGFFSFLSFLPLGFLPVGLLQTILAFVGVPLLFAFLVLKALAFYLGY